ncbi:polyphosphate polymerase domain-containing protein [Kineosporiaceae bacterium B12]|nr:polyphosphate polymerase domain-containing protein [Kineococcus rubinsiae]
MGQLPAVGLAELVEEAELLTRVDRKYVIDAGTLESLLADVPSGTRVLEIGGRRDFAYVSTYLDTPDLLSFHSSGRSRRRRWKVRERTYQDTGGNWLEVKTTGPRSQTVKQRLAHPGAVRDGLSSDGVAFVSGIIGDSPARSLHPVLVTSYRRTTLLLPTSGTRVTVDVDLGWTSLQTGRDLERGRLAVVETKTGSTPSPVDRLLWAHGHRPVRISKYGAGMAALHPELPRLKWHRALDRHLSCPSTPLRRGVTP